MSRSKTDYIKLKTLGSALEEWCDDNYVQYKRCSEYQWNIYIPEIKVIIAVYPGSGIIWVPKAHYTGTGVIDKSSTKLTFNDKVSMLDELHKIIFAMDSI